MRLDRLSLYVLERMNRKPFYTLCIAQCTCTMHKYSLSHLPVLQLARLGHSRWLAFSLLWASIGTAIVPHAWFTLMLSTLALQLLLLAVQ